MGQGRYDVLQLRRLSTQDIKSTPIANYEPIVNTDTMDLYLGQGTRGPLVLVGKVGIGSVENRPAPGVAGRLYFVNSGENANVLFLDTGNAWINVTINKVTSDQIEYQPDQGFVNPLDTDANNHVTKIWAGLFAVSAQAILAHMNSEVLHTRIEDNTVSNTEVWSSQKVQDIVNSINSSLLGNASEATSIGERAESLARYEGWYSSTLASEAASIGERGQSLARHTDSCAEHSYSIARHSESVADLAYGNASDAASIGERAESLAKEYSSNYELYTISPSTAGESRTGRLVYQTTLSNTVALAKANNEATMPCFGIIIQDMNTKAKVRTLSSLVNAKADSSAAISPGDKLFVSSIEAGKVTDVVPTSGVSQIVGSAKASPSQANVPTNFCPRQAVIL